MCFMEDVEHALMNYASAIYCTRFSALNFFSLLLSLEHTLAITLSSTVIYFVLFYCRYLKKRKYKLQISDFCFFVNLLVIN